jgi:hypothetical protein
MVHRCAGIKCAMLLSTDVSELYEKPWIHRSILRLLQRLFGGRECKNTGSIDAVRRALGMKLFSLASPGNFCGILEKFRDCAISDSDAVARAPLSCRRFYTPRLACFLPEPWPPCALHGVVFYSAAIAVIGMAISSASVFAKVATNACIRARPGPGSRRFSAR